MCPSPSARGLLRFSTNREPVRAFLPRSGPRSEVRKERRQVSTAYFPSDFREAPILDEATTTGCVTPRAALLVNPFYPKDPHASFGKHVLTPTLALTSIAASTP